MSRNVLDELTIKEVTEQLKRWRIATDKVGRGFGQSGWSDEQVRRALTGTGKTFHTRDDDYYKPAHRHSTYSLVFYDVKDDEMA
ncbi:hypothetical protein FJZ31_02390 [Candidatus Poribacteria bacterium]|nr:hypothetical protein [Candidatus Poribacteria bacterium]